MAINTNSNNSYIQLFEPHLVTMFYPSMLVGSTNHAELIKVIFYNKTISQDFFSEIHKQIEALPTEHVVKKLFVKFRTKEPNSPIKNSILKAVQAARLIAIVPEKPTPENDFRYDFAKVQKMYLEQVNNPGKYLIKAAKAGMSEAIPRLLRQASAKERLLAIQEAAKRGHTECVRLLRRIESEWVDFEIISGIRLFAGCVLPILGAFYLKIHLEPQKWKQLWSAIKLSQPEGYIKYSCLTDLLCAVTLICLRELHLVTTVRPCWTHASDAVIDAAANGHIKTTQLLLEPREPYPQPDNRALFLAFMAALKNGHGEVAHLLLTRMHVTWEIALLIIFSPLFKISHAIYATKIITQFNKIEDKHTALIAAAPLAASLYYDLRDTFFFTTTLCRIIARQVFTL